jgi:hypothetical protein
VRFFEIERSDLKVSPLQCSFTFLAFLRKRERWGGSILTIGSLKTQPFFDLLNSCGDVFEAGLEVAEGDLAGTANHREMIHLLFRNMLTGHNDFRDGFIFKDFLHGIERPKDRITVDLLPLILKVIINESNGFQIQKRVIKKFLKGIYAPLPHPIDQYIPALIMIHGGLKMFKDSEGTPCSNYEKYQEIKIDDQHSPAKNSKTWNNPKEKG